MNCPKCGNTQSSEDRCSITQCQCGYYLDGPIDLLELQAEIEKGRNRLQAAEEVLKFIVAHAHCMNSSVNESCTLGIDDPEEWCLYCKAQEYFKKFK